MSLRSLRGFLPIAALLGVWQLVGKSELSHRSGAVELVAGVQID